MAIFFDHQVQAPDTSGHVDICWHQEHPLLAVASRNDGGGGFVQLYDDEGEPIPNAAMQRSCFSHSLSWHPTKPILAVGWNSGEILIWNQQDKELYEAAKIHKADVCLLQWSMNGQRLLSGDKSGLLLLWKTDNRGRTQPMPACQQESQQIPAQCIFPPGQDTQKAEEMKALARAAVRGDEKALDMFSWRRDPSPAKSGVLGLSGDGNSCFVGGSEGRIYFIKDSGSFSEVGSVEGEVKKLLYNEHRNVLVVITKGMLLSQYSVSADGKLTEMMKVKLSGKVSESDCDMVWAGKGLLATATGECLIRQDVDLDKDDNYILGLDSKQGFMTGECINCVASLRRKRQGILAAGTDQGHIAMWKFAPSTSHLTRRQDGESKWKVQLPSVMEGNILQIKWGTSRDLLCINTLDNVSILSQHIMSSHMRQQVAVVQTGPANLSVDLFTKGVHLDLKTDVHVHGVSNSKDNLAIWNGKKAVIYEIGNTIRAAGTFVTESPLVVVHEQSVYTTEPGKIQVRNFQGTVKQLITLTEQDGEPICFDACEKFLAVATSCHMIKVFDISRREAKLHGNPRNMADLIPKIGDILMAKINSNGTKVAFICEQADGIPDSKVYIWDVDLDSLGFFDFATGLGDQEDIPVVENEDELSDIERGKRKAADELSGRHPVSIHWDGEEKKLLVCEARLSVPLEMTSPRKMTSLISFTNTPAEVIVVSLFSTLEQGVVMQDSFALHSGYDKLIGVEVPYYYFIKKVGEKANEGVSLSDKSSVCKQVMRDFAGLEDGDKTSRDAMMNFSFFLTIGNMDEAFKAIKLIKSESVWENMAKMCVKTRRLDVAKVCLGNMGHARGAKALREAENEPELDARVAMLAIQLGMLEEAERLYKNCERFDLLNELYQASGQWGKAMETAELRDRIHLRTTYYNYAKHLEAKGDFNGAIPNFEKSDTHRFEVPRMLFEEPQALEAYIMKNKDKTLRKWWAQYMESTGDLETALQFYEASQDYLSQVRIHCYCGALEKSCEVANETGDKAACYHLARQYELQEQHKEAVHFFTRAQAYSQAIRICKENDMADQLMNLALMSSKTDMIEAARYYETNPETRDKAVMLYHKGGHFSKALELAFESEQFGALQLISMTWTRKQTQCC
ncbi:putative intraflagellar transport protein [Apostichopus japonicus]|uniref:Putative intraflagellar transport protein n=1 Tax=Stichopus japonicus TaxID=307972 RepID=A0A2G8LN82_STIJA|nr:putative intraflagellar transport protein [Apostichopus japonicus]